MNNIKIKQLLLKDLAVKYGCNEDTFLEEGTSFRVLKSLNGKKTLYHTKIFSRTFISAGEEIIDFISNHFKNDNTVITQELLAGIFTSIEQVEKVPFFIYTKDELLSREVKVGYDVKNIKPDNHTAIQEFIDLSDPDDIDEAEVYIDDPDEEIIMLYHNNKPVGYAGYRRWGKYLGDVGILISRDHRKIGLGSAAVRAVTKVCMKNGVVPLYRTSYENIGSKSIAINLGFELVWTINVFKFKK
ncbi:MAG: GNAT family N-acetyltransferase [Spirochaetaceae bacterium]